MINGFFLKANTSDELTEKVAELLEKKNDQTLAIVQGVMSCGIKKFVHDISGCPQELFGSIRFPDMFSKNRDEISNTALVMFTNLDKKHHRVRFFPTNQKNEQQLGIEIAYSGKATFQNPGFLLVGSGISINKKHLFEYIRDFSRPDVNVTGFLNNKNQNFTNAFVFSNYLVSEQGVLSLITNADKLLLRRMPGVNIEIEEELMKKRIDFGYNSVNLQEWVKGKPYLVA